MGLSKRVGRTTRLFFRLEPGRLCLLSFGHQGLDDVVDSAGAYTVALRPCGLEVSLCFGEALSNFDGFLAFFGCNFVHALERPMLPRVAFGCRDGNARASDR